MTSTDIFHVFLHFTEPTGWLTFTCSKSTKETVQKEKVNDVVDFG